MHLMRWNPWPRTDLFHNLDRIFEPTRPADGERSLRPAVDIEETEERYTIRADLPGVKPEDVSVTVDAGLLTLRAERKREREVEEDGNYRCERSFGTYLRRFNLPDDVDVEGIGAKQKDGVLDVTIPKREESKPKKIEVDVQ